jgi:NAD(P)-dependent dehydrogenase (short-subunit alcohol dehydrogenase family)
MAKWTRRKASPRRTAARAALVTGAASGIGLAAAENLLEIGWRVAFADRDERGLARLERKYRTRKDVLVLDLDVTSEPAVSSAVAKVFKTFGRLDGVVNSAGIAADVHALATTAEQFRRILDVNVIGSFLVAREGARVMVERGGGAIVNIASVSGLRGGKGRTAYGASKGAVIVMTQAMANDLATSGVRVNAVAPGPVETAMIKRLHTAQDRALWASHVPMRRYGHPGEIASVIAFLLDTEASSYVTGEVIAVDGGFRGAGVIAKV